MYQQLTLRHLEKPREKYIEKDIEWVCESLGLNTGRDIDRMSPRIMSMFLKRFSVERAVPSEELAEDLVVTAARINHHVRNLVDSGLVYREKKLIVLRGGSLRAAIEELKEDTDRIFDRLLHIAQDVDQQLGLKNR